MSTGGPIESIAIANRGFVVAEDSDASVDYGGDNNEIQMNGDGSGRNIKSIVPWKVSGLKVQIDPDNNDHEFIQDQKNKPGFIDYEHTEADGNVYYAKGQITDTSEKSTKDQTIELTVSGPGRLTKQV